MGRLSKEIETIKKYHIRGQQRYFKCPKNAVKFNTHNSKEHEMKKSEVCFDIQKSGEKFITEAVCNTTGHIIDVVNLSTGEEVEIVLTHGEKQAKEQGRTVVKI